MFERTVSLLRRMMAVPVGAPPGGQALAEERRVRVRYPCAVQTTLQPVNGAEPVRLSGRVRNISHGGITCFVNVMGLGLQFAALGALAYQKAKEQGVGHEIPTDWFLEDEHP